MARTLPITTEGKCKLLTSSVSSLLAQYVICNSQLCVKLLLSGQFSSLLLRGVHALLEDDSFKISTPAASATRQIGEKLVVWIPENLAKLKVFEKDILHCFSECFMSVAKTEKAKRENMWTTYHAVRTSEKYREMWASLLKHVPVPSSPILCQYLGDTIFKELIALHHPQPDSATSSVSSVLTLEEMYGLRYAAGYIPRALKKKLPKSTHPLKSEIQLCIFDLLDEGCENEHDSQNWVHSINRGGLTCVNNITYDLFVAMEIELRNHLHNFVAPNIETIATSILESEDVQFYWCIVSSDWDKRSALALLEMIVSDWVKIRGFSLASAWVEKYKVTQKQTTQKSKGVRKQLISKPKARATATDEVKFKDAV